MTQDLGQPPVISVSDFHKKYFEKKGVLCIDVRTPAEYQSGHAKGAVNIPLDQISKERVFEKYSDDNLQLFFICQSGKRAAMACAKLASEGIHGTNLEGGTAAWKSAQLPMVSSARNIMSLERQVRIAAGGLVTLGACLAWFGYPGFLFLPMIVGLGLVFSGMTDTCGMAFMLGKMPWNQTTCSGQAGDCCVAGRTEDQHR